MGPAWCRFIVLLESNVGYPELHALSKAAKGKQARFFLSSSACRRLVLKSAACQVGCVSVRRHADGWRVSVTLVHHVRIARVFF